MFPKGRMKVAVCLLLLSALSSAEDNDGECNLDNIKLASGYNDLDEILLDIVGLENAGEFYITACPSPNDGTYKFVEIVDQSDKHLKVTKKDMSDFEEQSPSSPNAVILCFMLNNDECDYHEPLKALITDTNNHDPYFINSEQETVKTYEAVDIPMPFPKGLDITPILPHIRARDIDIMNVGITFEVTPSGYFSVESKVDPASRGKIYNTQFKVLKSLNFDEQEFTIIATDSTNGQPKLSSSATFTIKKDKEESVPTPKFNELYYEGKITEDNSLEIEDIILKDGDKATLTFQGKHESLFSAPEVDPSGSGKVIFELVGDATDIEETYLVVKLVAKVDDQTAETALIITLPVITTTRPPTTTTTAATTTTEPTTTTTDPTTSESTTPTDPASSTTQSTQSTDPSTTDPSSSVSTTDPTAEPPDPSSTTQSTQSTESSSTESSSTISTTDPTAEPPDPSSTTQSTQSTESSSTESSTTDHTAETPDPSSSTSESTNPSVTTTTSSTDPTSPTGTTTTQSSSSSESTTTTDPTTTPSTSTDPSQSTESSSTETSGSTGTTESSTTEGSTTPGSTTDTTESTGTSTTDATTGTGTTQSSSSSGTTEPIGSSTTESSTGISDITSPETSTPDPSHPPESSSIGSSQGTDPTIPTDSTTPTAPTPGINFKPYLGTFTLSGYETGDIFTFAAESTIEEDITYEIATNLPIDIGRDSGVMYVISDSDSLPVGEHEATIKATGGTSLQSAEINIKIIVKVAAVCQDGPRLSNSLLVQKVKELQEQPVTILKKDENQSEDKYEYCIAKQEPNKDKFYRDDSTGDIMAKVLDRDEFDDNEPAQFMVTVKLQKVNEDLGSDDCKDEQSVRAMHNISMVDHVINDPLQTVVVVIVEDINNHRPIFTDDEIIVCYPNKNIAVNVRPNYLAQAKATDKDSIESGFGIIEYSTESGVCEVDKDNGFIYPNSKIYEQSETTIEIAAANPDGLSSEKKLIVKVKLIGEEKISTLTLKGVRPDGLDEKLKELSAASGYTIRSFGSTIVPTESTRTRRSADDFKLQALVYALDDEEVPISTTNLKAKLEGVANLDVSTYDPAGNDGNEGNEENVDDSTYTGLLISTAILGALLVLGVGGALGYRYYQIRSNSQSNVHLMENGTSKSNTPAKAPTTGSNNHSPVAIRRPTGFVFGKQLPDEDIETDVDGLSLRRAPDTISVNSSSSSSSDSSNSSSDSGSSSSSSHSRSTNEEPPSPSLSPAQKVMDSRKSVTFNSTIEEIQIEKVKQRPRLSREADDSSDDDTEIDEDEIR